jgi:hypothetical protein
VPACVLCITIFDCIITRSSDDAFMPNVAGERLPGSFFHLLDELLKDPAVVGRGAYKKICERNDCGVIGLV